MSNLYGAEFRADLRAMVESIVANMLANTPSAHSIDGVVVPGSYNSATGEVDVAWLDTLVDNNPVIFPGVQLQTPANGFQSGPRGGERCVLQVAESGKRAHLEHGMDDSPGAPAGEHWLAHRSNAQQSSNMVPPVDAFLKFTNDAKSSGDSNAGFQLLAGAFMQLATAGGIRITMDDAANLLQLLCGSLMVSLDANAGEIKLGTSTDTLSGIVTKADLQNAISALAAIVQPGSGVTPPIVTASTDTEAGG